MLFNTREVLVAAKHLLDRRNVKLCVGGSVEYVHLMFDRHHLIWANGLLSETLFPSLEMLDPSQGDAMEELRALFPELFADPQATPAQTARRCLRRSEAVLLAS